MCYSMRDRRTISALLCDHQHAKRRGNAVRKTGNKKNLQSILQNRSWSFSSIYLELPDIFAIDDISKCTSISAAKYGLSN